VTTFLKAFRPIAIDFLSTIFFVALYLITGSIPIGVAVGIAVGAGQIGLLFLRGKRPDLMQWASLALVVVLGSASILTSDPRFIMLKPSLGAFAIGCVMLKPNWMGRYLPAIVIQNIAPRVLIVWGYVWSALLFLLCFANLFVALEFGPKIWAWYTSIVPLASQIGLFLAQYLAFRIVIVRKIRAQVSAQPAE
jgi:intracellular septation protein